MGRLLPAVGVLLLLAGPAGGDEEEGPPSLKSLTRQAAWLRKHLRRERDREDRKRLLERLELVHHQMGPTDADGERIHCEAMWHDETLERLDREMKRLAGRKIDPAKAQGETLERLGRLTVRRMARACLVHGWRIYTGQEKYQVDAFGQYLANNLSMLDGLMSGLSGVSAPAPGEAEGEAGEGKGASPLAKARAGLSKMVEAADVLAKSPSDEPEALLPPLGTFTEGLTAVREVAAAAEAEEAEEEPPAQEAPPESPPMTEAEKGRLAALRHAADALDEADWADAADHIERFASIIETGFTVAGARPGACDMLGWVERAADLARSLAASTLFEKELLAKRRKRLLQALEYMARPANRANGYKWIGWLEQLDAFRRRVEEADLAPDASRGLLQAYYRLAPKWRNSDSSGAVQDGRAMSSACTSLGHTLERMQGWPPEDLADELKECYRRLKGPFGKAVESAGEEVLREPQEALSAMQAAARRGEDLVLIVRAETLVQAIKRYRPPQGKAMYQRMVRAARSLAAGSSRTKQARERLEGLVSPFEALERFPAPEPALRRTLNGLLGKVYGAAVSKLSRDLRAGINHAAADNLTPLRYALRADDLFGLARKRALAEQARLQRVEVGNLSAFPMPPDLWKRFHKGLDHRLKVMFTAYVRNRKTTASSLWQTAPAALEAIYGPVVAAQWLALQARVPGETDLDFLVRNLQRVAAPDPPDRVSDAWTVGYHVIEAAATTIAGLDEVAEWHRRQMRFHRKSLDRVDLSAPLAEGDGGAEAR